jgi:signal transduction histidine kinase
MLVYATLQWLLVRPLRRLSESMIAFRHAPEDETQMMVPSGRSDEVGVAQTELAEMQRELRTSLRQKTRLAALGAAVSKVNHDLRNILATAQVVSDRLTVSDDPEVRRITPRLIDSIDRAINLCSRTLRFGQADEPPPTRANFSLAKLIDEVGSMVGLPADERIQWRNAVPIGLEVHADREQLFRVLLNLGRNACLAISGTGQIEIKAAYDGDAVAILVRDTGAGLPLPVRQHLFEPFSGAGRSGGTGLGLAIASDLMRAHGGAIRLEATGADGTCFRLELPRQPVGALSRH